VKLVGQKKGRPGFRNQIFRKCPKVVLPEI
jgi:hypothetical protein